MDFHETVLRCWLTIPAVNHNDCNGGSFLCVFSLYTIVQRINYSKRALLISSYLNEFDNYDNYNLNMLLIKRIILRRLNRTPYLLPCWIRTLPRGLKIHKTAHVFKNDATFKKVYYPEKHWMKKKLVPNSKRAGKPIICTRTAHISQHGQWLSLHHKAIFNLL